MRNQFYLIDSDRIPEAVEKVNQLRRWFNDAAPKIINELKGCKLIANGQAIGKRDMEKVRPILDSAPFRAFLSVSSGSIWLKADITYPEKSYANGGGFSVNYHEEGCYIGPDVNNDTPNRPILNTAEVLEAIDELEALRKEQNKLEERISEVISIIRPFGKG